MHLPVMSGHENSAAVSFLLHQKGMRLWLLIATVTIGCAVAIVSLMSWLLKGVVTWDYVLTGLVTAAIVAPPSLALLNQLLKAIAGQQQELLAARIHKTDLRLNTALVESREQRALAVAREEALQAAEQLAQVRRQFLANMSHEIRTPLNGVLGFAQIGVRHCDDPAKVRNAFEKILASGNLLLGVINEILDFSKIEAGKLAVEQGVVDLDAVIGHVFELVRDRAQAKHLELVVERMPALPRYCQGDTLRIGQVLLNLLSNAVKFTEVGTVALAVAVHGQRLIFRVWDTGIGMTRQQLDQLFNPFHQADGSTTRRFGGTGLGLAISKRLAELMSGDISVLSEPGKGSTFEFQMPFIPADVQAKEAIERNAAVPRVTRPLAGFSLLVVEDDPLNQAMLRDTLFEAGAEVMLADNGAEAVARVQQAGAKAYDAILMDIQMPEMNGYEATQQIRALAPDLPVIGQTAHAFGEDRDKCLAAGMVEHLAKPIDADVLVRAVLRHARRGGSR
jgi:signal transduction histidine kinase/ActR/RegA family two-component response regulator